MRLKEASYAIIPNNIYDEQCVANDIVFSEFSVSAIYFSQSISNKVTSSTA